MIDANKQSRFCGLLKYFQKGDYFTFKKICELAFPDLLQEDKYLPANLFVTSHISGLIEAGEKTGSMFWTTAFLDNIVINARKSRIIGTQKEWLLENEDTVEPTIVDWKERPLLLGKPLDPERSGFFYSDFMDCFPTFQEAEKNIITEEKFRLDLGKHYELFRIETRQWEKITAHEINGGCLLRVKKDFSSPTYYIINVDLGLLFRVLQPDWAFISALHLLNWSINDLFRFGPHTLSTARQIRLPALLSRFIFSASSSLKVGPEIEFREVDNIAMDWVRHLKNPEGERYVA